MLDSFLIYCYIYITVEKNTRLKNISVVYYIYIEKYEIIMITTILRFLPYLLVLYTNALGT